MPRLGWGNMFFAGRKNDRDSICSNRYCDRDGSAGSVMANAITAGVAKYLQLY